MKATRAVAPSCSTSQSRELKVLADAKQHKKPRVLVVLQRGMTRKEQQLWSHDSRSQDGEKTENKPPDLYHPEALFSQFDISCDS